MANAKLQLRIVLAVLLANSAHCTLKTSFEALAFTLSRFLPLRPDIIVPPTLLGEGGGMVTDKVLDQALMESEVCCHSTPQLFFFPLSLVLCLQQCMCTGLYNFSLRNRRKKTPLVECNLVSYPCCILGVA